MLILCKKVKISLGVWMQNHFQQERRKKETSPHTNKQLFAIKTKFSLIANSCSTDIKSGQNEPGHVSAFLSTTTILCITIPTPEMASETSLASIFKEIQLC